MKKGSASTRTIVAALGPAVTSSHKPPPSPFAHSTTLDPPGDGQRSHIVDAVPPATKAPVMIALSPGCIGIREVLLAPEAFGKYQVRRTLGEGAFASVYLCDEPGIDALYAVKVLSRTYADDEDINARFVEEARTLKRLASERTLRVDSVDWLDDGRPYFAADYADRGTLARLLAERSGDGALSLNEALIISREIAQCLLVVHAQEIVHRDLKPSNILFQSTSPKVGMHGVDGPVPTIDELVRGDVRLVLADFGIARSRAKGPDLTIAAGTPHYMAPEQAEGAADERSDIYAAAVIMYQLLTGEVPFPSSSLIEIVSRQLREGPPSIREIRGDIPESVDQLLKKGMAIEAANRFQTASEWLKALDTVASQIATGPVPEENEKTKRRDPQETIPNNRLPPWLGGEQEAGIGLLSRIRSLPLLWQVGGATLIVVVVVWLLFLRSSPPDVPLGLEASVGIDGIHLTWEEPVDASNIDAYLVYRDGEEIGTTPGTVEEYLDIDADLALGYEYAIEARADNGLTSGFSESVSTIRLAAPPVPTGLAAVVGSDSIQLSWNPPADEDSLAGFAIYRDNDLLMSLPPTATTHTDSEVDTGVRHEYSIEAWATEEIRSQMSNPVVTDPFVLALEAFSIIDGEIALPDQVDLYEIQGEAGKLFTLSLTSEDGQPMVEILTPGGEQLAQSAGPGDVSVSVRFSESGAHEVRVSLTDGSVGTYNVSYSVLTDINIGETGHGQLAGTIDEGHYNEWTFAGERGDRIAVTMAPDTASPRVELISPDGTLLIENEGRDGGVILVFEELPSDGDYIIRAGYTSGMGSYRLSVLPRFILRRQLEFSRNIPEGDPGRLHSFEADANTTLYLAMQSDTGSPLVGLFDPSGVLLAAEQDDDGNGVSFLSVDLTISGTYEAAASFDSGSGNYTLRVDRDLPEGATGYVSDADIASAGEIDTYTFAAVAGETIIIFMNSDDNDSTHWTLYTAGGDFVSEQTGGGRIEYEILEDGFYEVDVTFDQGIGPYSLTITRFPE